MQKCMYSTSHQPLESQLVKVKYSYKYIKLYHIEIKQEVIILGIKCHYYTVVILYKPTSLAHAINLHISKWFPRVSRNTTGLNWPESVQVMIWNTSVCNRQGMVEQIISFSQMVCLHSFHLDCIDTAIWK